MGRSRFGNVVPACTKSVSHARQRARPRLCALTAVKHRKCDFLASTFKPNVLKAPPVSYRGDNAKVVEAKMFTEVIARAGGAPTTLTVLVQPAQHKSGALIIIGSSSNEWRTDLCCRSRTRNNRVQEQRQLLPLLAKISDFRIRGTTFYVVEKWAAEFLCYFPHGTFFCGCFCSVLFATHFRTTVSCQDVGWRDYNT